MAGNLRADNNGDILVEFDYNNIIVVDPNKTIDSAGKIQERLIDHESLVCTRIWRRKFFQELNLR